MQKENYQQKHGLNYLTIDPCCEQDEDKGEETQNSKMMKKTKIMTIKITITTTEETIETTRNKKEMEKTKKTKMLKMKNKTTVKEDKGAQDKMDNR